MTFITFYLSVGMLLGLVTLAIAWGNRDRIPGLLERPEARIKLFLIVAFTWPVLLLCLALEDKS